MKRFIRLTNEYFAYNHFRKNASKFDMKKYTRKGGEANQARFESLKLFWPTIVMLAISRGLEIENKYVIIIGLILFSVVGYFFEKKENFDKSILKLTFLSRFPVLSIFHWLACSLIITASYEMQTFTVFLFLVPPGLTYYCAYKAIWKETSNN